VAVTVRDPVVFRVSEQLPLPLAKARGLGLQESTPSLTVTVPVGVPPAGATGDTVTVTPKPTPAVALPGAAIVVDVGAWFTVIEAVCDNSVRLFTVAETNFAPVVA
jgi:hypothetical protein